MPAGCLSRDFTTWSILNKAVRGVWHKSLLFPPNSQLSTSSQRNRETSANGVIALMRVHTRDSRQFRLIWCSWIRATDRRKKKKKGGDHVNVGVRWCDEMTASQHCRRSLWECFELHFGATSPNFFDGFSQILTSVILYIPMFMSWWPLIKKFILIKIKAWSCQPEMLPRWLREGGKT